MAKHVKILIVEDEPLQSKNIRQSLQVAGYEVIDEVRTVPQAQNIISQRSPDLALLDINLEAEENGIDLATWLRKHYNMPFIFITASKEDQDFVDAQKTSPDAYIIKPYKEEDLLPAIEMALRKFSQSRLQETSHIIKDHIFFKDGRSFKKTQFNDILCIESARDYKDVHLTHSNNKKLTVKISMEELLSKLPPSDFIQTSKSHIINKLHIKEVENSGVIVGEVLIPIGRAYKDEVFRKLGLV